MSIWGDASPQISGCTFAENRARRGGGALGFYGRSRSRISDCIFLNNEAARVGGGDIECGSMAAPTISHCIFYGGSAPAGGAVYAKDRAHPRFERTILAFCRQGEAIHCADRAGATLSCCNLFGNAGGDWVGCVADQLDLRGNTAAAPGFVDPEAGDLSLRPDSPLRDRPGCGGIGVRPSSQR